MGKRAEFMRQDPQAAYGSDDSRHAVTIAAAAPDLPG